MTAGRAPVAALVLAAGASTRMGDANKLLAPVGDRPMVAVVVDAALEAGLAPVVVVTGHAAHDVEAALAGRPVAFVHNPDAAAGMGTSLAAGARALAAMTTPRGVVVCLGDMPRVHPATLRALADALDPVAAVSICVPVHAGRRGNPVVFAARWLPELSRLAGDVGARALVDRAGRETLELEVDDPGVLLDVDTPEALGSLDP